MPSPLDVLLGGGAQLQNVNKTGNLQAGSAVTTQASSAASGSGSGGEYTGLPETLASFNTPAVSNVASVLSDSGQDDGALARAVEAVEAFSRASTLTTSGDKEESSLSIDA